MTASINSAAMHGQTMKKILLLGGSAQQVVAIKTAKQLGFYTVLCDYLTDNPGQYEADRFYLVSTTDREAVLEVAEKEEVSGVLAYASDPAAPTAAYVAEKMGLPTNPLSSVEILCNKDRFRAFLREHGFNAPYAEGFSDPDAAQAAGDSFRYPVIVKPVDSSGSKGASVIRDKGDLRKAAEEAFTWSRSHRIVVEEFIEKAHPYLIGGDLFIKDGEVVLWGLMNCHRDQRVNPLVPVGKSYPLMLSPEDEKNTRETLSRLVRELHISGGAMNVELVVDADHRVWPIDIGPRNGGNMIPDLLGMIFGVDVVRMSVCTAMGEMYPDQIGEGIPYYATHNLHSARNGRYRDIVFSEKLKPYLLRTCLYKKEGDPVEYFNHAAQALGIIFMKFENEQEMMEILGEIEDNIDVRLLEDEGSRE